LTGGAAAEVDERLREALEAVEAAGGPEELEAVRLQALGRKGWLTAALRALGSADPAERPRLGRHLHQARARLEEALARRGRRLAEAALAERLRAEAVDVTLPAAPVSDGRIHPLTRVRREIEAVFGSMGYSVASGPEVELESYNFDRLNIPPDHPARDMQDSFFPLGAPGYVLRTHTSPVQIRAMEAAGGQVPLRVIAPGRTFRRDADDATHASVFHQVEGLAVDRGLSMADLKGTLEVFARALFGPATQVRLRPSYFPFTEPSAELDITCVACAGAGCRLCKESGFIEILGAGMVHPRVLRAGGYDPEEVSGFAFGMGIERVALLRYGIGDIRLLTGGDLGFLAAFPAVAGVGWGAQA
jgi:phenylalanyl-tRNA synthetase alpha chain